MGNSVGGKIPANSKQPPQSVTNQNKKKDDPKGGANGMSLQVGNHPTSNTAPHTTGANTTKGGAK